MSRIGTKPIEIPTGVSLEIKGSDVSTKGAQGELSWVMPEGISCEISENVASVARIDDSKSMRELHGLSRSLIANMVEGVAKGYRKDLELQGVGFRAQIKGRSISLAVGFSSPVEYEPPEGVTLTTEGDTNIIVTGADKQKVGDTAARIRSFAPAEPYKGKGIRYKGEQVRRKAGKTVA